LAAVVLSLLALLALLARAAFAAPGAEPAGAKGDIRFIVDAASFQRSGGAVSEEIYLLIPNKDLRFVESQGGGEEARIRVRFRFRSWPVGERILEKTLNAVLRKGAEEGEEELQILQHAFRLPEGPYQLQVRVEDKSTRGLGFLRLFWRHPKRGEAVARFEANRFPADRLGVSDIEFARSTLRDSKSEFSKGGREVLPQPNRLFGALLPALSFYYEVYDFAEIRDPRNEPYRVTHQVVDSDGAVRLQEVRNIAAPPDRERMGRTGTLDLTGLPAGSYVLRVVVENPWRSESAEAEARFHVAWKGTDIAAWKKEGGERSWSYAGRGGDEVVEEMRTLLTQGEIERLQGMSPEEKTAFVDAYWRERDPSPETDLNELREEHYRRIRVANIRFESLRMKGMETDRGRIFIRYGEPDEIRVGFADRSFVAGSELGRSGGEIGETGRTRGGFNVEEKEYEVWTYNERGRILGDRGKVSTGLGMRFVFVDLEGYGNYRLIESSEEGDY
jgi:GWxTD domain-containing protein